jgi:hypothetical protein
MPVQYNPTLYEYEAQIRIYFFFSKSLTVQKLSPYVTKYRSETSTWRILTNGVHLKKHDEKKNFWFYAVCSVTDFVSAINKHQDHRCMQSAKYASQNFRKTSRSEYEYERFWKLQYRQVAKEGWGK